MKKFRLQVWFRPNTEITSSIAATMYELIGTSVNGGCNGLPDHPRKPLNFLPLNVKVGRIENFLITSPRSHIIMRAQKGSS